MIHPSTITIKGKKFQCWISTIGNSTKTIIHTTVGVIKSLIDEKDQKKFQRLIKKDKSFKEYCRQILLQFVNIPIYGCIINGKTFVVVDGQHRVWHIFNDDTPIEMAIFDVSNWPGAADKFYHINNTRPISPAISLHNSIETGIYLRQCANTMIASGYIENLRLEGRCYSDGVYELDCQDISLLIKASATNNSQGALHTWIRTHKHEYNQKYIENFTQWMIRINQHLFKNTKSVKIYDRNIQVAIASFYNDQTKRDLLEHNIIHYVNDKNYKFYRANMKNMRGDSRKNAWKNFLYDTITTCDSVKIQNEELRVVALK